MIWQVPKIWEGGDVWILGGGPSVTKQFNIPDEIVQSVINGTSPLSIYSSYMSFLHDKHVIGINVAYLIGDWIDMIFFGDNGFFLSHQQGLAKFSGIKISCNSQVDKYNWIKYLPKNNRHPKGISESPRMVSWNGNSGAAAISIAAHSGAKRIILLGFDMKLNEQNHQHWHDVYHKLPTNQNPRRMKGLPFDRHLRGFPDIARDAKMMGIEILNASPDSAIQCFKKVTVQELVTEKQKILEEVLI